MYYITGLLIIAAMTLFLMNAVAGRVWCGYLCPQTIWTDLFLMIERLTEGDRRKRMQLEGSPWTLRRIHNLALKHFLWLMVAWWTGGAWVLYFTDAPTLFVELATFQAPAIAYIWILILTCTTYVFAGFMREQVCTYMCPWPRIQAALTDSDALNVTYRYDRGEPRASVKQAAQLKVAGEKAGDCVECKQCIAVCPTGIDIREGTQLGCIQCGLCIDACDEVMGKLGRETGLIGYDTINAVEARALGTKPPALRIIRPRTLLYAAIIAIVGGAMLFQLATRAFLDMSVVHERTPLFTVLKDGSIRNAYTLRIANKRSEERPIAITLDVPMGTVWEVVGVQATADWRPIVTVPPDSTIDVKLFVTMPKIHAVSPSQVIQIKAADLSFGETASVKDNFFAP